MTIETMEKYCPICGKDVAEPRFRRFGEWACSEGHAEEHVKEVRAQKQRQLAAAGPAQSEQRRERHRGGCC